MPFSPVAINDYHSSMLAFPNAKINIGLFVTARRSDGFHDLETVFLPVPLRDVLEIIGADAAGSFTTSGIPVAGDPAQNLVMKAYELLQSLFPGRLAPLSVFLYKNIPMGAGLGGGSADGATMLYMLNEYFKLGLAGEQLEMYALQLGSDCPFFIRNKPCFASGRGELMEPVTLPDLSGYDLQLVCPELHISTAEAFRGIDPQPAGFPLRNLSSLPFSEWRHHLRNDFEITVFARHPALEALKQQLYEQGAIYASMTGTGSSVYAFFEKGKKAAVTMDVNFREHILSF